MFEPPLPYLWIIAIIFIMFLRFFVFVNRGKELEQTSKTLSKNIDILLKLHNKDDKK